MPRLTALDLSLTATGLFTGDPLDPTAPYEVDEIATPDRKPGERDVTWNGRRFDLFSGRLLAHLERVRPELLVLEVTGHAHLTSRGIEYRAGLGLGRSLGWIDGALVLAAAYGYAPGEVETIEAKDVKLRVAGARAASKPAVQAALAQMFGWDTRGWRESQVDALAVGLGWLRQGELQRHEQRLLAAARSAEVRAPARSGRDGTPRRR